MKQKEIQLTVLLRFDSALESGDVLRLLTRVYAVL